MEEASLPTMSVVPNPDDYTLVFLDNSVFNNQSDCNSVAGTYKLEYEILAMVLGPSTMAFYGEDSLDAEFQILINKVAQGSISPDGQLWLYLQVNAGRMTFTNGGPAPKRDFRLYRFLAYSTGSTFYLNLLGGGEAGLERLTVHFLCPTWGAGGDRFFDFLTGDDAGQPHQHS